ncbi:hypothetical protein Tco_0964958 [Tanacetum coccineum]
MAITRFPYDTIDTDTNGDALNGVGKVHSHSGHTLSPTMVNTTQLYRANTENSPGNAIDKKKHNVFETVLMHLLKLLMMSTAQNVGSHREVSQGESLQYSDVKD